MLGEDWQDQYRRLLRSYELLKRTADPNIEREELHEEAHGRDILYHFCCDAFHLADWIRKSDSLSQSIRDDVSKLFKVRDYPNEASKALAACRDIANAVKHLHLDPKRSSFTPPAEVTTQTQGLTLPFTLPAHFQTNHWTIDVGGDERDALDVAADAIRDWKEFLENRGLLPLP